MIDIYNVKYLPTYYYLPTSIVYTDSYHIYKSKNKQLAKLSIYMDIKAKEF